MNLTDYYIIKTGAVKPFSVLDPLKVQLKGAVPRVKDAGTTWKSELLPPPRLS